MPCVPEALGVNYCSGCSRDFGSIEAHARHRIVEDGDRRCMTDDELRRAGFAQNAYGRLTLSDRSERARRRFQDNLPSPDEAPDGK
jgi:hypothetical protein